MADGLIAGNRPEALPAPMSWLEMPLRFGIGPSGSVLSGRTPADEVADLVGEAEAAVTATVSAADGGVHFSVVVMRAVAVSFTEVTMDGAGRDRDLRLERGWLLVRHGADRAGGGALALGAACR